MGKHSAMERADDQHIWCLLPHCRTSSGKFRHNQPRLLGRLRPHCVLPLFVDDTHLVLLQVAELVVQLALNLRRRANCGIVLEKTKGPVGYSVIPCHLVVPKAAADLGGGLWCLCCSSRRRCGCPRTSHQADGSPGCQPLANPPALSSFSPTSTHLQCLQSPCRSRALRP